MPECEEQSEIKVLRLRTAFSDIHGVVHNKYAPEGKTKKKRYYHYALISAQNTRQVKGEIVNYILTTPQPIPLLTPIIDQPWNYNLSRCPTLHVSFQLLFVLKLEGIA